MHLRHAAERIRILNARVAVTMRLADLAVGEQLAQERRGPHLAHLPARRPGCARRTRLACPAAPRATSRPRRAPFARGARVDKSDQRDAGVRLRAVDERDALLRREHDRLGADLPQHFCAGSSRSPVQQRSFADQREREMRERREVAARADASLLRDRRVQIGVQHLEQQIDELRTRTGVTLGDHVGAQQHHRAHLALGKAIPDAGRVAPHEIHLQLGQPVARNGDIGQLAESGRHSVYRGVAVHDAIHDRARAEHPFARLGRETDPQMAYRNRIGFIDGERVTIDEELVAHFFFLEVRLASCAWSCAGLPCPRPSGQLRARRHPTAIRLRPARSPLRPASASGC